MNDLAEAGRGEGPHSLETLFPEGRIRLAEISVYNWGTFGGSRIHTAAVDPNGTLITGHTGAGKTTFVDAHQVLMSPPGGAYFNMAAAQNDRRDRSLLTYVRGKWASAEDSNGRDVAKFKRPKEALSGVRALYRTDSGLEYTLAALFWISATGTSVGDINRQYIVARRNLALKDLLHAIRGDDKGAPKPSSLTATFAGDGQVSIDGSFDAYSVRYRRLLRIENEKAPALLARAMGLKRIEDLTSLVRTLVLEEPQTRDKALAAIAEFDNLNAIHAALDDAQRRKQALDRFPAVLKATQQGIERRDRLLRLEVALPRWYARQRVALIGTILQRLQGEAQELREALEGAVRAIGRAEGAEREARRVYDAAGGVKLDTLRERAEIADQKLARAARERKQTQAQLACTGLWAADTTWTEAAFANAKQQIAKMLERADEDRIGIDQAYDKALIARQRRQDELADLLREVRALEAKPDSLIPSAYQTMRAELCRALEVSSEQMPFVGELIAVAEPEASWRGAIERVLGFRRLRLLVEPDLGRRVTSLVNERHMGRRVGIEFASPKAGMTVFKQHSFLRKLEWKDHAFRDWLRRYLSDATLDCVDSVEEMRDHPFSMTEAGLVHGRQGSYDKNDDRPIDDPRGWYLGFNNQAKKQSLLVALAQLERALRDANDLVDEVKRQREQIDERLEAGRNIAQVHWDDIDIDGRLQDLEQLRTAIIELESKGVDLKRASEALKACEEATEAARLHEAGVKEQLTLNGAEQLDRERQRQALQERAWLALDDEVVPDLTQRFATLSLENLSKERPAEADDIEREAQTALKDDQETVRQGLSSLDRTASSQMTHYRNTFRAAAAELPERGSSDEPESLASVLKEWVQHYEELVREKLPELLDRFQQSLNKQATQSLTVIFQAIQTQGEEIEERIDEINTVLKQTEFKAGVYLELSPIKLQQDAVRTFDAQLRSVLQLAAAGRPKEHFEALKTIVSTLQRATDPNTRGNKDSLSQLDARFRMDFAARIIDRATGEPVDYLRNTGGKSGGEKEGFTGSIVAAALAYVLKPAGARYPTYCTVFLDEAFANTSDVVAKRVLSVFKKLGLHLNLITPFKNVQLVRHVVSSAVVVSADADMNSSLVEVTWEEIDRQMALRERSLAAQAERLGVTLEEVPEA
jgi:uncharacterized protein YPO0396